MTGRAVVEVPGSKSIANRALVCAVLADGTSTLHHLPDGDDTTAMLTALDTLGAEIHRCGATATLTPHRGHRTSRQARYSVTTVDAGLAGTTSRFLTALAAVDGRAITVDGGAPLRARPMGPLHQALVTLGAQVTPLERPGHLPVTITGGELAGGTVRLPGDVSSQFVSALMMIGPILRDGLVIELTSPLVSRPYVSITAAVMAAFGASAVDVGERTITVAPSPYVATDYVVEPDASSASYPLAAAAITCGTATVAGLGSAALQGDARFADLLATMGCEATVTTTDTTVRGTGRLRGIDVDMVDMSDLVPTLAAVALFADSPTTIRGVGFIRAKESDRLGDLRAELVRLGADVTETGDGLVIRPTPLRGAPAAYPPRPPPGDGVRGDRVTRRWRHGGRSECGVQELAKLLDSAGRPANRTAPEPGGHPVTARAGQRPVVAAFDVDGTLTVRDCVAPFLLRLGGRRPAW